MKRSSRYTTENASLADEVRARKEMKKALDSPMLNNCHGTPYAIAYGVMDTNTGAKKLFKNCPVFYSGDRFDEYVKHHRQTVLAVYSHA